MHITRFLFHYFVLRIFLKLKSAIITNNKMFRSLFFFSWLIWLSQGASVRRHPVGPDQIQTPAPHKTTPCRPWPFCNPEDDFTTTTTRIPPSTKGHTPFRSTGTFSTSKDSIITASTPVLSSQATQHPVSTSRSIFTSTQHGLANRTTLSVSSSTSTSSLSSPSSSSSLTTRQSWDKTSTSSSLSSSSSSSPLLSTSQSWEKSSASSFLSSSSQSSTTTTSSSTYAPTASSLSSTSATTTITSAEVCY